MIWFYGALLVVWGNSVSSLFGASARLPGGSWPFVITGAALVALSLGTARVLHLDPAEVGGARANAIRGAAIGALAAAVVALAAVGALRLVAPAILGAQVDYGPLSQVTAGDLELHVVAFLPFGAVLPEEVAFRGVLLAGLLRGLPLRHAVVASAMLFALWHAAVAVVTVGDTTIGPPSPWFLPAIAGAIAVVFAGGVVFALLRLRTGTLTSTVAAHWVFNAVLLLGLWSTKPLPHFAP